VRNKGIPKNLKYLVQQHVMNTSEGSHREKKRDQQRSKGEVNGKRYPVKQKRSIEILRRMVKGETFSATN